MHILFILNKQYCYYFKQKKKITIIEILQKIYYIFWTQISNIFLIT